MCVCVCVSVRDDCSHSHWLTFSSLALLLPRRYFILTSLIMSNVLLSIFVSAYARMQDVSKKEHLASLSHIAGRSCTLLPQQCRARQRCVSTHIARIVARDPELKRCGCGRGECKNKGDPLNRLRTLAQLQKGAISTKLMRSHLRKILTSYQSDRIVSEMQTFDRMQEQRKREQLLSLNGKMMRKP